MKFIREKQYICINGNGYTETDIFQISDPHARKLPRAKKERLTLPAQKRLNEENSRRALRLILNDNFVPGDFDITLTYQDKYLPADKRAAHDDLIRYIRKLRSIYQKHKRVFKYLYVTEFGERRDRIHHHVIASRSGFNRDTVEDTWTLGRSNVKSLRLERDGTFNKLANYLMKSIGDSEKYARTWNCSRNVSRPDMRIKDDKISAKQLRALVEAKHDDELKTAAARLYNLNSKDIIDVFVGANEITGLVFVKLRYMDRNKGRRKPRGSSSKSVCNRLQKQRVAQGTVSIPPP